jgi:hypothetical protein
MQQNIERKLTKYFNTHNYKITNENISLLMKKLYSSILFKTYNIKNNQSGGANFPSEYLGVNSKSYVNSNTGTNTSPTNTAIRPEITSDVFPMNGGTCPCMIGGAYKGCGMTGGYKQMLFFTNVDMKYLKNNNFIIYNNKNMNEHKDYLNNLLNNTLINLMNLVKNKNKTIGEYHINKL